MIQKGRRVKKMYQEISKLIMYGNMDQDCILYKFADIFRRFEMQESSDAQLTQDIYTQIKRLLEVATDYGFDKNLWHNYLTFILITNENPFSITCEKVGANDGSVNAFAKNDFQVFMNLFHYDFSKIEAQLGINCFSVISDYKAIVKKELMYNKNVSEKVQVLSEKLAAAKDVDEFFAHVTEFYRAYGVGMFGLNKAFRITGSDNGKVTFHPINNMDKVMLDDLIGYEIQKKKLVENTEAFVQGRKANNALLFGDSGFLALLLAGVTGFTPSVCRAAVAVWVSALGVWVYGASDALTSLAAAGILMTARNSYAVCDIGFELSFAAVLGTLAGAELSRHLHALFAAHATRKKKPAVLQRILRHVRSSLTETVCIGVCASAATFPVLVLRGLSVSLWAVASGVAVLWLVQPMLLLSLGTAFAGLVPVAGPLYLLLGKAAEALTGLLNRWTVWIGNSA